ncbi:helix-turn-helix transcriptional regulator [Caldimonas tepidiphila]|uniref:helix-turn-helix transcriptional regulator n=1 Tax=Caldimonas tepidiphila TaxID=2315841 RepID=UPI001F0C5924|nr:helix-turn-helix transcriptional regulator [Caldimonas tepidiphila]
MSSSIEDLSEETGLETTGGARAPLTIERFSQILEALYEVALDPGHWVACLEKIRREFAGNYSSLIVRPGNTEDLGLIVSASGDYRVLSPHNRYIAMSPFTGLPPDKVVTIQDLLSESDWRASAYYRDWCAPHQVFHVLAADIVTQDGSTYGFRVTRSEEAPAFSAEDVALARRLVPHLKRALNLHLSIHQDRRLNSLYGHAMAQLMVGVVVLDQNGLVIESNPAATGILAMNDGLRIAGQQLEATYVNDNRKLQRLVREALAHPQSSKVALTEAMSVSRPSGQLSWGVVVQAISPDQWTEGKRRPSVAVFVRDTEGKAHPPVKLAQQLFQLTPAETALAIELANGLSLEEAAEALGIRRNTARAHLRSIFSKTGVRRQTELVRIFLNSVAWLGSKD